MTEEHARSERRRTPAKAASLSLLCIIFLIVPNFNIIDVLPDFVAYLIIARFFGKYADYAPYFAEAREGFSRLSLVALLKIPAMVVMMMNIGSGRDIVPLFTLVFTAIELMLLFPAVSSAFLALFYVGERGSCSATISHFTCFGRRVRPDSVRFLTYVFITVKGVLTFIPDTFLLTHSTDTSAEMAEAVKMKMLFPAVTAVCMAAILLLGIFWGVLAYGYASAVAREGRLGEAALSVAGEERLRELEGERSVRRILRTLTVLMLSSLLCFDVTFSGLNDGVNVLPHCLYALLIIAVSARIFDRPRERTALICTGIAYSVVSILSYVLHKAFAAEHYYGDLGAIPAADRAYTYFAISSVIELICFALLIFIYARAFVKFLIKHTTLSLSDERYGAEDAEFSRKMKIKAYIFAYFPLLISLLKCIEVFLRTNVKLIVPVNTSEADVSTIVTNAAPWFGFVIVGVCIAYVFYSYYFINEARDEVRMKYSNEKQSFE